MMGFDLDLFSSKLIAQEYMCAVCQSVACDVHETECGHLFCRSCVSKLIAICSKDSFALCPHCRSSISWETVHASKYLERKISNLNVFCPLCKSNNNKYQCKLSQLTNHQKNDCSDFKIDCEFKLYGCKEKIKRKNITLHNKNNEVNHLKLKIIFLENSHDKQMKQIIKKYENEKTNIELKWKQKILSLTKQLYNNSNINNNNNNNLDNSISLQFTPNKHNNNNISSSLNSLSKVNSDGTLEYIPNYDDYKSPSDEILPQINNNKIKKKIKNENRNMVNNVNNNTIIGGRISSSSTTTMIRSRNYKNNTINENINKQKMRNNRSRSRSHRKQRKYRNDNDLIDFQRD